MQEWMNEVGGSSAQWFVRRGLAEVGPVSTDLLLRGIARGRVPDDAMVRQPSWSYWRSLVDIRETGPLRGRDSYRQKLAPRSNNWEEALLFALDAAFGATCAHVGLLHRRIDGQLTTVAVRGADSERHLGQVLAPMDPAMVEVHRGKSVVGAADRSRAHRAASFRLASAQAPAFGVLALPLIRSRHIVGVLELGRHDHEFRKGDKRRAWYAAHACLKNVHGAPNEA